MSLTRPFLFALSLFSFGLVACGDSGDGDEAGMIPEVDCTATPAKKFSEMSAVWAKCTACHSSAVTGAARGGAPVDINYDTYAAAKAEATPAASEVAEGAMPPGGGLTDAEKEQIYAWAQCGTPE